MNSTQGIGKQFRSAEARIQQAVEEFSSSVAHDEKGDEPHALGVLLMQLENIQERLFRERSRAGDIADYLVGTAPVDPKPEFGEMGDGIIGRLFGAVAALDREVMRLSDENDRLARL